MLQTGCASGTAGKGYTPSPGEIMTSSDITEARRRAIIRLQLAVGYLERGQLEVALDEVKRRWWPTPATHPPLTCVA